LTYENLGIRPLLIDKLGNYSTPKPGVPLPCTGSHLPISYVITIKWQPYKRGAEACLIISCHGNYNLRSTAKYSAQIKAEADDKDLLFRFVIFVNHRSKNILKSITTGVSRRTLVENNVP